MRFSLDTNILVYAIDPFDPSKFARAGALIESIAAADSLLSQQVMGEFLNYGRKRGHGADSAFAAAASHIRTLFPIITTSPDLMFAAFALSERHRLQYWDAAIVRLCIDQRVDILLSEDMHDGLEVEGLRILNPFNPANDAALADWLGGAV